MIELTNVNPEDALRISAFSNQYSRTQSQIEHMRHAISHVRDMIENHITASGTREYSIYHPMYQNATIVADQEFFNDLERILSNRLDRLNEEKAALKLTIGEEEKKNPSEEGPA
ncbi:hypothetical protein [Cloacibacillus porcorum]